MGGGRDVVHRVVIVEDDRRFLSTLDIFFQHLEGFELVGRFLTAESALERARQTAGDTGAPPWDLVLMDLELPKLDGIEATRRLKSLWPGIAVVVLTAFEDPGAILEAIRAGADGYLVKRISARELRYQLAAVLGGGSPLTAGVARSVLQLLRESAREKQLPGPQLSRPTRLDLTDREQEVLRCLVRGMSYSQAADELRISVETVRGHIRSVYGKLQVHNVAQAVSRAIRERLV